MVCFDTTRSMDDFTGALVRQTRSFFSEAATLDMGLRWGLGRVRRHPRSWGQDRPIPFTDNKDNLKGALAEMPRPPHVLGRAW